MLFGLTVAVYLAALGTFDFYVAVAADLLLLATVVCGTVRVVRLVKGRRQGQGAAP